MKKYALYLALLCGALAQPLSVPAKFAITSNQVLDLHTNYPSSLFIKAGTGQIVISFKTGNVELPKDMKLPDAAVAFWLRVAQAFPECRRAIISGNSEPLTTEWLESRAGVFGVGKQLGLRSDGVVVWREIK